MKHPVMTQRRKLSPGFDYKSDAEVETEAETAEVQEVPEVAEVAEAVVEEVVAVAVTQPEVVMKPRPTYTRPTVPLPQPEVSKHPRNTLRYSR